MKEQIHKPKMYHFCFVSFCRYWNVVKTCWKARKKNANILDFAAFLGEWRDISMLRLLQAFLESAPQLVLQLYILLQRSHPFEWRTDWLIASAAGSSLLSMIWAILAYSKSLRDFRKQGYKLSLPGLLFQLLWRISMVTSRVVAMVLFASSFQNWLFVALGTHWLLMTTWLICQRTRFCTDEDGKEHPCREKLFCAVIGFMYIFCFFNTREGMTRKRVVLFYSIILVENSLLVSMWYPHRTFQGVAAFSALGVVWGGLVFGILCMILYYRFYHPSLPVQGIILQKRTFDLEGQKTHTWVCCCCCRVKESKEDTIAGEGLITNVNHRENRQAYPALELEILPRSASREILQEVEGTGSRAGSYEWISCPDSSTLIHSTPARPLNTSGSHARHPLIINEVPRITVTGATPEVMSPVSNSSLFTFKDVDIETLDEVVQRSQKPSTSLAGGIANGDGEDDVSTTPKENLDWSKEKENFETRRGLDFQNDINTNPTSPKSPTSREIIGWFRPDQNAYGDDSLDEGEEKPEKINYGSLSFGNRYSLVSSDCISLSSESSRSSLDSIVFADEGPGCSGVHIRKSCSGVFTPRAADEGIFSDERDSPLKANVSASDDPDVNSEASTPQKRRVNAQFPVLGNDDKRDTFKGEQFTASPGKLRLTSASNEDGYELVELLMDAPSTPSSSLKRRNREVGSSLSSEEKAEVGEDEPRAVREGSVSEREDGHESESTDISSDSSHIRTRHRSCDEIETGASGVKSSPDAEETNKRHTFDFSQLSKGPRSPGKRRRDRKYRRSKRKDFDNFVVTTLRPGKYGSLRRSIDRMARIQEDAEETFLLNTEAALNACIPEYEDLSSPNQPDTPTDELPAKTENDSSAKNHELNSSVESSNPRLFEPQINSSVSARESFMRRKRLKRFLSKELAPGRFSSVRRSSESCPSDENFQLFLQENELGGRQHMSVDSLPSRHLSSNHHRRTSSGTKRKEFSGKTTSLPNVKYSGLTHNKQNPEKAIVKYIKNSQNAILFKNAENNARNHDNRELDSVPNKRHTYDFTHDSARHLDTRERLLGKDGEKRSAEDRQQRRSQSEVLIGSLGSGMYV